MIPDLTLELKQFGIGGGHFVISTILIRQEFLEIGKRYKIKLEEADE